MSAACVRVHLPTHQCVGMGEAYRIAKAEMHEEEQAHPWSCMSACSMA